MPKDEELYQRRFQRYAKAFLLEEPEAIPIESPFTTTFALEYAGYDLKKDQWDPEKVGHAMGKVIDDFDFDFIRNTSFRAPHVYGVLGAKTFVPSETGFMQHPEVHGLEASEYPEFIADPYKTILEKVMPRLYTEMAKSRPYNLIALTRGILAHNAFFSKYEEVLNRYIEKNSVVRSFGGKTVAPFDFLADFIRGFNGISIDIRRHRQQVKEACEAVLPLLIRQGTLGPKGMGKTVNINIHMLPFIKLKDFEELYWPTFKKLCEALIEQGYYLSMFFEGDCTRFLDYLQELPPKKIIAKFEYGDPALVKEKLGKVMCLQGFYPISLLKTGTKKECIAKADEIVSALAPGGGYMFYTDKIIIRRDDINPENYHAVIEYIRKQRY